jgi:hypothetical protein
VRVDDYADVRAGDKGNTLILAVIPRDETGWRVLRDRLTTDRVGRHFGDAVDGTVIRHELPQLPALVFRVPGVLAGGVTGAVTLDGHGKTLGYHLLMLEI